MMRMMASEIRNSMWHRDWKFRR